MDERILKWLFDIKLAIEKLTVILKVQKWTFLNIKRI